MISRSNPFLPKALPFIIVMFFISNRAYADETQLLSLIKGLQEQMTQMQRTIEKQDVRILQLEKQEPQLQISPQKGELAGAPASQAFLEQLDAATGGAGKWLKGLKFGGDLRMRYEAFHYHSGNPAETDDRNRFRYRLRYGLEKKFNEEMKIGFGFISGEIGAAGSNGLNTDPTSTNTSFDNNFNFKPIFIDKAYATYTPNWAAKRGILNKTEITAGKMVNPFEKGSSEILWDRDVRPEGIAEKVDLKLLDTDDLDLNAYATAGQFVLDEDASVGGDANLFAYQLGLNPVVSTSFLEKPVDFLQAVSFYDFSNYARKSNFLIGTTSLARGNPNVDAIATELDAGNFRIMESYSELAISPFGIPTRFHLDLAGNPVDRADGGTGATVEHGFGEDFAYGYGIKLGGTAKKGDWEIGYQYRYIGANAVVGAFSDSDFGDGFAGKRGSSIKLGYALTDSLTLNGGVSLVNNLNSDTAGILDQEQRRFNVDLSWKF